MRKCNAAVPLDNHGGNCYHSTYRNYPIPPIPVTMSTTLARIATAVALALAAQTSSAWALFGSSSANAAGRLKSADRLLEKADAAFEAGDVEAAGNGYSRAYDKYRVIERDYPEFNDGIAKIRLAYCRSQLAECGVSEPQPEDGDGATAPDAAASSSPESAAEAFSAAETARAGGADSPPATETAPSATADDEATTPYNPRYIAYDFGEARELIERGRHADAIEILVPMVKYDPDNRQLRMLLATARLGAGQADLAIATLEDLRGQREDFPLLLLIAAAYTSGGRYPEALLALDNAAKLAPGNPDPYSNLAWLALLMDDNSTNARSVANSYYQQALKRGALRDAALEGAIGAR